jgi:prefoldin subunit 5
MFWSAHLYSIRFLLAMIPETRLKEKVPELEKSLTLIRTLLQKKDDGETSGMTRYSLTDGVYGRAQIDYSVGTVNLWLGANVMLEYTYEDAIAFLKHKLETAQRDLQHTLEDLAFVRDQIVTTEVNISRVYNFDVKRKRASKEIETAS